MRTMNGTLDLLTLPIEGAEYIAFAELLNIERKGKTLFINENEHLDQQEVVIVSKKNWDRIKKMSIDVLV